MNFAVPSNSPERTFYLAEELGKALRGDELLLLSGDLGAGKTLFTKGIASALEIDTAEVVSPTFTLMNIYRGRFPLYHIDLYRLGEEIAGGIPEVDDNLGEGVIAVEWAQYLDSEYFNIDRMIHVDIRVLDEENRLIVLTTPLDYIPNLT